MGHFEIDNWFDFLWGLLESVQQQAMNRHLRSGCRKCSRAVDLLKRVVAVAETDSHTQPPDYAVRSVKALLSLRRPDRASGLPFAQELRLAFDSLLEPAPVGTRSLHSSSRSLVFYSHRYALTLQMDYSRARTDEDLVLGGEIVRRGGIPVPNIPVFLVSGHRVLAHCFSGPLGDFQLSCHLDGVPSLGLVVDADEWLEVNLGPTQRPSWAPDSRTTGGSGTVSGAPALPGSTY